MPECRRLRPAGLTTLAFALLAVPASAWEMHETAGASPGGEAISMRVSNAALVVAHSGRELLRLWTARNQPPAHARPEANERVCADLEPGTLAGVVHLAAPWHDYRDQEIAPGTYTLRYAVQPRLKDHVGVSDFRDFFLLVPLALDHADAQPIEEWIEASRQASGTGHPAVLALLPAVPAARGLLEDVETTLLRLPGFADPCALVLRGHGRRPDL